MEENYLLLLTRQLGRQTQDEATAAVAEDLELAQGLARCNPRPVLQRWYRVTDWDSIARRLARCG